MGMQITYSSLQLDEGAHQSYEQALKHFALWRMPYGLFLEPPEQYFPNSPRELLHDHDPSDSDISIAKFLIPNSQDIEICIAKSRVTCETLKQLGWEKRLEILCRARAIIARRAYEIAACLTYEVGKTRREALAEVYEVIAMIDAYERFTREEEFYRRELAHGFASPYEKTFTTMEPLGGPVGVIGPFNFPFALVANGAICSFLAGNPFIVKAPEESPISSLMWCEIIWEAFNSDVPATACMFLAGPGEVVGDALVRSRDIAKIAFTGSREVGMHINRVRTNMSMPNSVIAEMGGKNPVVITCYANLQNAAEGIINSVVGFGGQKCSAASRVYVQNGAYTALIIAILDEVRKNPIVIGDPKLRMTRVGPLISKAKVEYHNAMASKVLGQGGLIFKLSNTNLEELPEQGHFVIPYMAGLMDHNDPIACREHFTPFFTVHIVKSLQEAVQRANDTPFGLCAGIFSENQEEIEYFLHNIRAGNKYVNRTAGATTGAWPTIQTFGGLKESNIGGLQAFGPFYILQFAQQQCSTIAVKSKKTR